MESNHTSNDTSDIRKTKFTLLKDQECSLNMQIRLAMQLHNLEAQEDLERKLNEVREQISQFVIRTGVN